MSENVYKCSRCHSTQHIKYFGENRRGKPYKTCNRCRERNINKNKDKVEDKDNITSKETKETNNSNCAECGKQFINTDKYYNVCKFCTYIEIRKKKEQKRKQKNEKLRQDVGEEFYNKIKKYITNVNECNELCSYCGPGLECAITFKEGCICGI